MAKPPPINWTQGVAYAQRRAAQHREQLRKRAPPNIDIGVLTHLAPHAAPDARRFQELTFRCGCFGAWHDGRVVRMRSCAAHYTPGLRQTAHLELPVRDDVRIVEHWSGDLTTVPRRIAYDASHATRVPALYRVDEHGVAHALVDEPDVRWDFSKLGAAVRDAVRIVYANAKQRAAATGAVAIPNFAQDSPGPSLGSIDDFLTPNHVPVGMKPVLLTQKSLVAKTMAKELTIEEVQQQPNRAREHIAPVIATKPTRRIRL